MRPCVQHRPGHERDLALVCARRARSLPWTEPGDGMVVRGRARPASAKPRRRPAGPPPIALGHALSIGIVAGAFVVAGVLVNQRAVRASAGLLLIGWAVYHQLHGHRHRVRVGMKTGQAGLVLWSFLMATAHGAGLMILPAMIPLCLAVSPAAEITAGGLAFTALAAVAVHMAAMLAITGVVAIIVYEWVGLSVLRTAWINLDLIWTGSLAAAGLLVLCSPRFAVQRPLQALAISHSQLSAMGVPAQPVDATQALNLSAGVSNCKVSRGRSFSWRATCSDGLASAPTSRCPLESTVSAGHWCLVRPALPWALRIAKIDVNFVSLT